MEAFICDVPDCSEDWMLWTLTLGGYLAWESYQLSVLHQDHVSQLPGRAEFQACLESEHEKAVRDRYPLALLLVNPDEFGLTNHRLGRETGDAALREVAMHLSRNLRRSDGVFRYGGAVFCILMPGTTPDAARAAADKLRQTLSKHGYLDGGARFAFSTGVAVYEPGDDVEATCWLNPASCCGAPTRPSTWQSFPVARVPSSGARMAAIPGRHPGPAQRDIHG